MKATAQVSVIHHQHSSGCRLSSSLFNFNGPEPPYNTTRPVNHSFLQKFLKMLELKISHAPPYAGFSLNVTYWNLFSGFNI